MILFFSSPIGLGHIARDLAIMDKIMQLYDYNNFGFVTGSMVYNFIFHLNNSTYGGNMSVYNLYNPPIFSVIDGKLNHGFDWLSKNLHYYNNCKKYLKFFYTDGNRNVLSDLILSDEDFASLSFTKNLDLKRIFITGILHNQFSVFFII